MKYKILKGTELFDKLTELNNRMNEVKKAATELAKSLGGGDVATTGHYLAGGIDAIEFEEQPEGWKRVGKSWQGLYYPKSNKKAILKQIGELPVVRFNELNDIIGFRQGAIVSHGGIGWATSVSMKWHKDFILMLVPNGIEYTPVKDTIEILGSEYEQLSTIFSSNESK